MTQEHYICDFIEDYYEKRGLQWPNFDDAMKFAITEIAEAYEIDLSRKKWVRNNPDLKPTFNKENLSTELGDAIMMLLVAGIVEGVDPLESMIRKMKKKLEELGYHYG